MFILFIFLGTLIISMDLVPFKSFKAFKRDIKSNELSFENQFAYDFLKAQIEFIKNNSIMFLNMTYE